MKNNNTIKSILLELKISTEDSIAPYFPRVRDRDDVSVLRCSRSGVILLSRTDHMDVSHYNEKRNLNYWNDEDRQTAVQKGMEDATRRSGQLKDIVAGKKWIDIGTGAGAILDLLSPVARQTAAIEPQENARKYLVDMGYKVFPSVEDVRDSDYEVASLFHVLEHLINPIDMLSAIRRKMAKGGKIFIEVPHAQDFMITFLENEAFKAFTFWSEHLILHTRDSLKKFLETAGFKNINIEGFQRYPLANHLYWLTHGKPSGHEIWKQLRTPALDHAYMQMLDGIDKTDTLIAVAETDG